MLAALREARENPTAEASLRALRQALSSRSCRAAAKAAAIAGQFEVVELSGDLVAAFDRFLEEPGDDPGCTAKAAIAEALYRLGPEDPAVFLRGLRCVQMEPVWGGRVDTAVDVRGACALGLVRSGYREALVELAALLADPEPPVRISAARAVAYRDDPAGVPLLRFKAAIGDDEPRVVTECLAALLRLDPRGSLPFVVSALDDPRRAEAAAMALGESRLPEAFEPLRTWRGRVAGQPVERVATLALAALRSDEAFAELIALVETGPVSSACGALEALAGSGDEALRSHAERAAAARPEPAVSAALRRAFGPR
jgi:HEAT repeat protein